MAKETQPAEGWELEVGGLRLPLTMDGLTLGRDPECDLPLADERASWRHLQIELAEEDTVIVTDLESKNGTFVNGRRLEDGPRVLTSASMIQLGSTRARLTRPESHQAPGAGTFRRFSLRGRALRIGRAPDNDVCLDEPNVSWHHAEIRPGSPATLVDRGSRNGVRLGDRMVSGSAPMGEGALAGIGPFSLQLSGEQLTVSDERGGQRLTAHEVAVDIGERYILYPTSLSVAPGEFVALIGASGSGKTTLLKCLAGVREPSHSAVTLGPDPVALRQTDVGYVPQSDVVHDRLTVRETLEYTARLRLPADTKAAERERAVAEVLAELRLEPHAETMVGSLSGGQRKRVGCGVELVGNPTMLLMDEPTSGLDPPLETRLMRTLRNLADSGRGVVVVTHATSNLALCDTVALMGEGGAPALRGLPGRSARPLRRRRLR